MRQKKMSDLQEAERRLTMNLSIIAMLKGNTPDEIIANLRREWVEPLEDLVRSLRTEGLGPKL